MDNRALVVDDSVFQRTVITDALEPELDVVAETENDVGAVDAFEVTAPDAVPMDVVMSEMTEIEAVKAGADGYVAKPVDADALLSAFRDHLG